jgi:hypothetical protein
VGDGVDVGIGVTGGEDEDALPLQAASVSMSNNNAHGKAILRRFIDMDRSSHISA